MYGSYVTHDGANESPGGFGSVYSSVLMLMICICALVGGLVVPVGMYICARTVRIYGMGGYHVCIICAKDGADDSPGSIGLAYDSVSML